MQPSEEFRREPKQEPVETITKPILDSAERPDRRASDPADKRSPKVSEADTPSDSVKAQDGSTAAANIKAKKAHRNSTDSSMSGIVWSAVVEKFSEMAQEIAGEKPSASSSNRLAAPHATIKSSALSVSSVAISSESSYTISEAASDSGAEKTTNSVNPSPGSPEDKDEEQDTLDSDDHASPPGTLNTSPKVSVVIEATKSLSEVLNLPPIKRRSKSFVATSIMKKPTKPVAEEVPASDSSSYQSGAYTVIKLRRGRTVRVQSHHAVNVEGDYAAFLAKASGGEKRGRDDGDTLSLKSGKSNRSGRSAWSTKSGVENGCFR